MCFLSVIVPYAWPDQHNFDHLAFLIVMLKSRPGFESGPRPRPIWAWAWLKPNRPPGPQYNWKYLNNRFLSVFRLFLTLLDLIKAISIDFWHFRPPFGWFQTYFRPFLAIFGTFNHPSGDLRPNLGNFCK